MVPAAVPATSSVILSASIVAPVPVIEPPLSKSPYAAVRVTVPPTGCDSIVTPPVERSISSPARRVTLPPLEIISASTSMSSVPTPPPSLAVKVTFPETEIGLLTVMGLLAVISNSPFPTVIPPNESVPELPI